MRNTTAPSPYPLRKSLRTLQLLLTLLATLAAVPAQAQRMPQDSWYLAKEVAIPELGQMRGIAQDGSGNTFVSDSDHACIRKFDPQWRLLKSFASLGTGDGNLDGPESIAIGKNQKLYVVDKNNNRIQTFDLEGNSLRNFGTKGTSDGKFNEPSGVAIGGNDTVYVSDRQNNRVQAFTPEGVFLFKFGTPGSLDGQFAGPGKLSTSPINGNLAICDTGNNRVQTFDANGVFLNKTPIYSGDYYAARERLYNPSYGDLIRSNQTTTPIDVNYLTDGCFIVNSTGQFQLNHLFSATGEPLHYWPSVGLKYFAPGNALDSNSLNEARNKTDQDYQSSSLQFTAGTTDASGNLYNLTSRGGFQLWKRTYRVQQPPQANAIPLPSILSQSRRAGTSLVDVEYIVKDADDDTVQTAALAFKDGGNTLRHIIPITTLVEGTASNLGAQITTGQPHRFTWDVTKDWATDFGEVQIEILAKDKRNLLNFDFIQIPAGTNNPAIPGLKISRSPLSANDFLSVWYWLIATGDPEIRLDNGYIYSTEKKTIFYDGTNGVPGLRASYYSNATFQDAPVERIDSYVDLRPFTEDAPFQGKAFSVTWNGKLVPSNTGDYYIEFRCGSYHRIWINNQLVSTSYSNTDGSFDEFSYVDPLVNQWFNLTAGKAVSIRVDYSVMREMRERGDSAQLYWWKSDGTRELIPPCNLFSGVSSSAGNFSYTKADPLAEWSNTSATGVSYILRKMGLREATGAEVWRAKEAGTPGKMINQWEPKFQVGPGERPLKVNAYGFDTGASGTWVVPLNN